MKQTLIKELMTTDVVTLDRQQAIPLAQELMRMLHIRHVPVVDDATGKLEGLVTHRGLLGAQVELLSQLAGTDDTEQDLSIPVSKAMTTEVFTVTPDTTVADALRKMLRNKRGSLPVVEDDKVVGIVTSRDFLRFQLELLERSEEAGLDDAAVEGGTEVDAPVDVADSGVVPLSEAIDPTEDLRTQLVAHVQEHRRQRWIFALLLLLLAALLALMLVHELRCVPPSEPVPAASAGGTSPRGAEVLSSESQLKARPPARHTRVPVVPRAGTGQQRDPTAGQPAPATSSTSVSVAGRDDRRGIRSDEQQPARESAYLEQLDPSIFRSFDGAEAAGGAVQEPPADPGAGPRGPLSPADRRGPQGSPWVPEPMGVERVGTPRP